MSSHDRPMPPLLATSYQPGSKCPSNEDRFCQVRRDESRRISVYAYLCINRRMRGLGLGLPPSAPRTKTLRQDVDEKVLPVITAACWSTAVVCWSPWSWMQTRHWQSMPPTSNSPLTRSRWQQNSTDYAKVVPSNSLASSVPACWGEGALQLRWSSCLPPWEPRFEARRRDGVAFRLSCRRFRHPWPASSSYASATRRSPSS